MIFGSFTMFGSKYHVILQIVNVTTSAVEGSAREDSSDLDGIVEIVDVCVADLFESSKKLRRIEIAALNDAILGIKRRWVDIEYDSNGRETKRTEKQIDEYDQEQVIGYVTHEYDNEGMIESHHNSEGNLTIRTLYKYDVKGIILGSETWRWWPMQNQPGIVDFRYYEYD